MSLTIDNTLVATGGKGDYTLQYVPVSLAKGQHLLTLTGRTAGDSRLRILFGGPGALSLNGRGFRHPRRAQ